MMQEAAAGPKTEIAGLTARMQHAIEDVIVSMAQGVDQCIATARTAKSEKALDDTRSVERRDAVQLVDATATLLQAISKLKGEFRHDYRVTRDGDAPARKPLLKQGWSGDEADLLTRAEYDMLSAREQTDYCRWTEGLPPRFGGWTKPRRGPPDEDAYGLPLPSAAHTPSPSQNRGSNKDVEKA